MRYTCCPQTDGDAEVWKDRGAPFGIPFSIRDLSSKCINAPGELLEKTMIAKEENVSSVHAQVQTPAHAAEIPAENQRRSTCSPGLLCMR